MTDKPLDCTATPGPVGKHDFLPCVLAIPSNPDAFDYHRVWEWAISTPRKPAGTAFTASTNRQVAYLIEELEARRKGITP